MRRCWVFRHRLYAGGPPRLSARDLRHGEVCEACRGLLHAHENLGAELQRNRGDRVDLWPGLRERLDRRTEATEGASRAWLFPGVATAAAAAILILALGGSLRYLEKPAPALSPVPVSETESPPIDPDPPLVVESAGFGGGEAVVTLIATPGGEPIVFLQPGS